MTDVAGENMASKLRHLRISPASATESRRGKFLTYGRETYLPVALPYPSLAVPLASGRAAYCTRPVLRFDADARVNAGAPLP